MAFFSPIMPDSISRHFIVTCLLAIALASINCGRQSTVKPQTETHAQPTLLLININTASADKLMRLPGIGSVTAEKIVAFRMKYGPYRRIEHLLLIEGVSENKFENIRHLIKTK
jgi:competence protein ComEA